MVTRQALLLCTALWRPVNLCHLGAISCTYCSLFYVSVASGAHSQSLGLHEWVTDESFFVDYISAVWCLYPFPGGETFISVIHYTALLLSLSLSIPASQPLPVLLSPVAKYRLLPGSLQRKTAGGHAQCQPPYSSESGWRHRSSPRWLCTTHQHFHTYRIVYHIRPVIKGKSCVCACDIHKHTCVYLWKREGERERDI